MVRIWNVCVTGGGLTLWATMPALSICFCTRLSPVAERYCIACFAAASPAGKKLESFDYLPCIDLLSAAVTCEERLSMKTPMKTGLEDAFVSASRHLRAEPGLFHEYYCIGHEGI